MASICRMYNLRIGEQICIIGQSCPTVGSQAAGNPREKTVAPWAPFLGAMPPTAHAGVSGLPFTPPGSLAHSLGHTGTARPTKLAWYSVKAPKGRPLQCSRDAMGRPYSTVWWEMPMQHGVAHGVQPM